MTIHDYRNQRLSSVPANGMNADPIRKDNGHATRIGTADAVQLSHLSGVLNSLQQDAQSASQRNQRLTGLVQTQNYLVNSADISRKLVDEFLNQ